ncbi:MAG: toll/interleukin-1 receptor domain-containing protein [Firmicutes bacterium]|nr:toll/interleukin-1 receptor domain-containing protein [Bacillota bacterium]
MFTRKVFVSFDLRNDRKLLRLIKEQTELGYSTFMVESWSLSKAASLNWEEETRARISRTDRVLVMVGKNTYQNPRVLREVQIALDLGVQVIQMIGYRGMECKPVPNAGRLYWWDWDILKVLMM